VSDLDITWNQLASRAIRGVLARKDVGYSALASGLKLLGIEETARSVDGKIQRGTFKFSFFLQSLCVVGAELPLRWRPAIESRATWESRASAVLTLEMAAQPSVTFDELSRRLNNIGVEISMEALTEQIASGTYPLTLALQCAAVLRMGEMERFIDFSDLAAASRGQDPHCG
jgi:Domain of unknown function (DUF6471)